MDKFMIIFINFSKNKKKNKIQVGLSHRLNNNKEWKDLHQAKPKKYIMN
jgi:hypothetical protein